MSAGAAMFVRRAGVPVGDGRRARAPPSAAGGRARAHRLSARRLVAATSLLVRALLDTRCPSSRMTRSQCTCRPAAVPPLRQAATTTVP